jgi:MFS family permease
MFNVWGIVLNNATYVEYYYNTYIFEGSALQKIATIFATQIFCMFSAPIPTGWLYQKHLWFPLYASAILLTLSHSLDNLNWGKSHIFLRAMLGRGIFQGLGMGTLATMGTLCLASHYRNNIPLVSMMGNSVGFIGALVYTSVAYVYFQEIYQMDFNKACYIDVSIAGSTLLVATLLIKRHKTHWKLKIDDHNGLSTLVQDPAASMFVLSFWILFFGLFSWPTYSVLWISSAPGQTWPTEATTRLTVALIIGMVVSSMVTSTWLRSRFGTVNTLICACHLIGIYYINLAVMPWPAISYPCTALFGACLGSILSLYTNGISVMIAKDKRQAINVVSLAVALIGAGTFAAAGILVTAAVVDNGTVGFQSAMVINGVVCVVGGFVMGSARLQKTGRKMYVAI